jgi:hypothetical protein
VSAYIQFVSVLEHELIKPQRHESSGTWAGVITITTEHMSTSVVMRDDMEVKFENTIFEGSSTVNTLDILRQSMPSMLDIRETTENVRKALDASVFRSNAFNHWLRNELQIPSISSRGSLRREPIKALSCLLKISVHCQASVLTSS